MPAAERLDGGLAALEAMGLVLGRALYEGVLLDCPLAPFFVSRLQVGAGAASACPLQALPRCPDGPALRRPDAHILRAPAPLKPCSACTCMPLPAGPLAAVR